MKILKLIRLIVLRNIREEKFLTFLSIIGIALGIGLFVGVKVASDRAIAFFESDVRGIEPATNYEIFDVSGIDFDERVYRDTRSIVDENFPVVKTFGHIPALGETIDLNGIYTVKALDILDFAGPGSADFESFYRTVNGVLITSEFSEKHGVKKGDTLTPIVYDREYPLKVVDIVAGKRLPKNMVVMDIGNYQEYFGKAGGVTRIDLIADDAAADSLRRALPTNLRIERVEQIVKNRKGLVASFRYNLQ
ncbi:MAG: ABC transporter permease, partial [Nitrospirota bacterium]